MAKSVSEQMPLAEVKNRLSEVVGRLEREHDRVVITKHRHPAAVVMTLEDLESLEETLDAMDSADLLAESGRAWPRSPRVARKSSPGSRCTGSSPTPGD
jgi:prevent-host-death family protein